MSTLKVNTIQNTSGVEVYTAKAWVNFNGTGTVAIRASGNVSSITDIGTGYYLINLTNAITDTNYCILATTGNDSTGNGAARKTATNSVQQGPTTTTFGITSFYDGAGYNRTSEDSPYLFVAIFR